MQPNQNRATTHWPRPRGGTRVLLLLSLLLALLVPACAPVAIGFPFTEPSSRVLFIGNSFTFYNDGVDQDLKGLDPSLAVQRVAVGGYTLKDHWESGQAAQAIRSQHWNYVVLQEQSQMPVIGEAQFSTDASLLSEAIRADGAEPILFMTWQRPDSVQGGVTTSNLANAYYQVGSQVGARVAPVGIAFANALYERPELALNIGDGHPTAAGTYLAACVIYATIFAESPVGLGYAPAGITQDERDFLQQIAAQAAGY